MRQASDRYKFECTKSTIKFMLCLKTVRGCTICWYQYQPLNIKIIISLSYWPDFNSMHLYIEGIFTF